MPRGDNMKSAYELAMERLGGAKPLSAKIKQQLAEVDSRFEAKKAEALIAANEKLHKANGDAAAINEIRENLSRELARFDEKRETEKNRIREKG